MVWSALPQQLHSLPWVHSGGQLLNETTMSLPKWVEQMGSESEGVVVRKCFGFRREGGECGARRRILLEAMPERIHNRSCAPNASSVSPQPRLVGLGHIHDNVETQKHDLHF